MSLSIIIAEDHAITRQGLKAVLEERLDARVVAETGDGLAVVALVEQHAPGVLILDLALPGLNGLDVLRRVERCCPDTAVVVVSMHSADSYVVRALHSGAAAYVLKGAPTDELIDAVHAVRCGEVYLSTSLPETLAAAPNDAVHEGDGGRYEMLTDREREVLQLIAEGYTSSEIGDRLFISRRTVDKHRENLMAKLELQNRTALIRFALQRGLIPLDPPDPPDGK